MQICRLCGKKNDDLAQNCANCGCCLNRQTQPPAENQLFVQTPVGYEEKYNAYEPNTKKKWWIGAGVAAAVLVVIGIIITIASGAGEEIINRITGEEIAKFKMNGAGDLYYDGEEEAWDIEIPREFDGKASGFADAESLQYVKIFYDGSLETFLKYHSWVFYQDYSSDEDVKRICCNDYYLEFALNDHSFGVDISYKNGGAELVTIRYIINDTEWKEIECFGELSEVYEWAEEN